MKPDADVPPLSPAQREFLAAHAETGAPTARQLARVKGLVLDRLEPAAVVPMRSRQRWLPPEVLTVAALVAVAVVAELVYLRVRPPPGVSVGDAGPGVEAVVAAYRVGDLRGAARLAASSCTDANCASLSAKLLRALELTQRFQTLTSAEVDELAKLDEALSGGEETELTRAIRERRAEPEEPEQLLELARAAKREGRLERALTLARRCLARAPEHPGCASEADALEQTRRVAVEGLVNELRGLHQAKELDREVERAEACTREFPTEAVCYRLLGSALASVAARDQTALDHDRARESYRRFLELAPPDDPYVVKVKAILDADESAEEVRDQFQRGVELRATTPDEARRLFEAVLQGTAAGSELHQQAREQLEQLEREAEAAALAKLDANELYMRGYQLRETAPERARAAFRAAMEKSAVGSDVHQKARSRLRELDERGLTDLYLRGYQLREAAPDEAKRLFRELMEKAPAGSEFHERARARLEELERR
ncbi:MAG: hypothetical protein ACOZQL_02035 [Myxococcota bacterium]